MPSRRFVPAVALWACAQWTTWVPAQESSRLTLAAETSLRQARQLLEQNDVNNAVILLDMHRTAGLQDAQYVAVLADAYARQMRRFQDDGKVAQASEVWEKLQKLPQSAPAKPAPAQTTRIATAQPVPSEESQLAAGDAAFVKGQYAQARQLYQTALDRHEAFSTEARERFAYCRLHVVASRLNTVQGQLGAEGQQLEREVRAALELAPRLDQKFGQELLTRLRPRPHAITTAIRHLDQKEGGWSVCTSTHFRAYHQDRQLAEQVLQIAELTRTAVCRKWLGHDVTWTQPCQIYVHPNADSYHRLSGMPATAPGHSDYDADKHDASIIHVRRVYLRADHAHMLTAILPHEVTHVVLNGQFGRRLLPRWADEGMAVLSEPYARIGMHLEPLPKTYQEGRALGVNELLTIENYPADRSKVASFYGQSVCLVEYLTSLRGPQGFVAFMRDANGDGDAAALKKHYGLTIPELEVKLKHWIVTDHMPTLLRPDVAQSR